MCHNPYFNRWFSAMTKNLYQKPYEISVTILILIDGFLQYGTQKGNIKPDCCHNPYFNRWFSAIDKYVPLIGTEVSHNPYFNRWFSAI